MTDLNKAELRRLAAAATGGDWEYRLGAVRTMPDSDGYVHVAVAPNVPKNWRAQRDTNMSFIAAANPAAMLVLLDEVDRLRAEVDSLNRSLEQAYANYNQVSYASTERGKQVEQLRAEVKGMRAFLAEVSRTSGDKWAVLMARELLGVSEAEESDCINSLKAVRRDSERYRWLRERCGVDFIFGDYSPWLPAEGVEMNQAERDTTDAAIDQALAKEGGANG